MINGLGGGGSRLPFHGRNLDPDVGLSLDERSAQDPSRSNRSDGNGRTGHLVGLGAIVLLVSLVGLIAFVTVRNSNSPLTVSVERCEIVDGVAFFRGEVDHGDLSHSAASATVAFIAADGSEVAQASAGLPSRSTQQPLINAQAETDHVGPINCVANRN